jgi:hypothetical protein
MVNSVCQYKEQDAKSELIVTLRKYWWKGEFMGVEGRERGQELIN